MILQVSGHPDDDPIRETLRFSNGDVTSAREQVQGWIIKFLGLVSTLVIFASVSVTHAADSPLRFPFVYGSISVNTLPLWLAKEQGFLRKYNLDPQLVFIISGRAAQAMVAGEVDVQYNGASHVANAVISGADMTVLLSFQNKLNFPLVVRAAIKNGEDLKGKKIAIGTPAGTASIATY